MAKWSSDKERLRQHDLTVAEIKSSRIFMNFTDEQAQAVIDTMKRFTEIIYRFYHNQKNNSLGNRS